MSEQEQGVSVTPSDFVCIPLTKFSPEKPQRVVSGIISLWCVHINTCVCIVIFSRLVWIESLSQVLTKCHDSNMFSNNTMIGVGPVTVAPQSCTDFTGPSATDRATDSSVKSSMAIFTPLNELCSLQDPAIPMRAQSTGRYEGYREMISPPLFAIPYIIDRGTGFTS